MSDPSVEMLVDDDDNLYVQTSAELEVVLFESECDRYVKEAQDKGVEALTECIAGLAGEVVLGYFQHLMPSVFKAIATHYGVEVGAFPSQFQIEAVDAEMLPGFIVSQEEEPDEEG